MAEGTVPSVGEILELLTTCRLELAAQHGEHSVKNYPISDQGGTIETLMGMLLRDPQDQGLLQQLKEETEDVRKRFFQGLLALLQKSAKT